MPLPTLWQGHNEVFYAPATRLGGACIYPCIHAMDIGKMRMRDHGRLNLVILAALYAPAIEDTGGHIVF